MRLIVEFSLTHIKITIRKLQFPKTHPSFLFNSFSMFRSQRGEISRSDVSLSIESALESFDFLEDDLAGEASSTVTSNYSGTSGHSHHDTGYNSTDDVAPRDTLSPLRSISRGNSPVHDIYEDSDEQSCRHLRQSEEDINETIEIVDRGGISSTTSNDESCTSNSTVKIDCMDAVPSKPVANNCDVDGEQERLNAAAALPDGASSDRVGDNSARYSGKNNTILSKVS